MTPVPASERAVEQIADLLHREVGLRLESSAGSRLRRCIRDGAASRHLSLDAYLESVLRKGDEYQDLLNDLTVQETSFFRHPEQFEVLGHNLLPELRRPVQIWSVACANGQEAFSLAMVLDELQIAGSVIATDLSTSALERTAAATYSTREIGGLSEDRIARYLTWTGTHWLINQPLRDRVITARHNLVDPVPRLARGCQVIFCRNVLIYISARHTRAFVDRIADAYPAGTPLFLGAAEALWQVTDRFEPVRLGDTFLYRLRPGPSRAAASAQTSQQPTPRPVNPSQPTRITPPPVRVAAAVPLADVSSAMNFARAGEAAAAAGDHRSAIVAFRAHAFLDPDDPMAHVNLALALEAAGDRTAARRAFGIARRTLATSDPGAIERSGAGYTSADILRLLDAREGAVST